jgi:hypothetical protein
MEARQMEFNWTYEVNNETNIKCGGMGAHEFWDRNTKKAKRDGFETTCAHCGKGMAEDTGFIARWVWTSDTLVPLTSTTGEVIRLGNTCVKNFFYKEFKNTHFAKAGA